MPRKNDSVAIRRKALFWHAKKLRGHPVSQPLMDVLGECPPKGSPLENPSPWDAMAREALRLDDNSRDDVLLKEAAALSRALLESLRQAFDNFRLDPGDPFSWRLLLTHFAFVEFGERPKRERGRPLMYTPKILNELLSERSRIMNKHKKPQLSNMQVAELLANDKDSPFYQSGKNRKSGGEQRRGVEGLRKMLGTALRLRHETIPRSIETK